MKMTDLKREHFPNGHAFSQKALDDYMAARAQVRKEFVTRYALSLLIGVVAGFIVLMLFQGGVLRIFLAMLCIMIAALIGTKITAPAMNNLQEQSRKLLLTKKDFREAKKHLRNGTVAWGEAPEKIPE